ncbi:MAG: homogentisate 1,2-dioxygenase, partial [Streptomycetaceae bacterium]|nr:homogentisate 1,2-dioxygenase [Streptomycetaceae bacterium]
MMFYCGGAFEARKGSGIGQGSISLHPGGHAHGPQPGAYERSIGTEFFDELADSLVIASAGARSRGAHQVTRVITDQ